MAITGWMPSVHCYPKSQLKTHGLSLRAVKHLPHCPYVHVEIFCNLITLRLHGNDLSPLCFLI